MKFASRTSPEAQLGFKQGIIIKTLQHHSIVLVQKKLTERKVRKTYFYKQQEKKNFWVLVGHSAHTRHTANSTHAPAHTAWRHRRHFSAALHRDEVVDFQYHVRGFGS